jgi:hypothetical protein
MARTQTDPTPAIPDAGDAPVTKPKAKARKARNFLFVGLLLGAVITAVTGELAKPAEQRTWNGKVWGFLPYDLRMPTVARAKQAFWSPDDPILVPRLFGVGWNVNVGAVVKRITDRAARSGAAAD